MAVESPFTKTVSNHGLVIIASNRVVGGIFEWSDDQARAITPVYEFGGITVGQDDVDARAGEPYENVPGIMQGMSIRIARFDIYTDRFVEAFGTKKLDSLASQHKPVDVRSTLYKPDGTILFTAQWYGFWFTNMGTAHQSTGDRIVRVNATASFTRRREL